jgi:hypothetical protein
MKFPPPVGAAPVVVTVNVVAETHLHDETE